MTLVAEKKITVAEYWIVDYQKKTVEVYVLINGDYDMVSFADETGEIESVLLQGLKIRVTTLFD